MVVPPPFDKLMILVKIANFKVLANLSIHILLGVKLKREVRHATGKCFENFHIWIGHDVRYFHIECFIGPLSFTYDKRTFVQGEVFPFHFQNF